MERSGIALSVLTAGISGVSIFVNGLFVTKVDPMMFAFLRNALVAIIMTGFLVLSRRRSLITQMTKREWGMV